jgi:hypothetical protein
MQETIRGNGRGGRGLAAATALAGALVAAGASEAQGCVGSGLLIPVSMQLLIFNLVIALLEAAVARFVFRASFWRAYGIMILANYFSLAAGLPLVRPITEALEPLAFSGPRVLYIRDLARLAVWVTFGLTIAFEMPFGLWLMRDKKRWLVKAAAFTLASRALVYFLVPIQSITVGFALRGLEAVLPDTRATRNPAAVVYYLDNNKGDLWSVRLDGTDKRFVAATSCKKEFAFLVPTIDEAMGGVTLEARTREWGKDAVTGRVIYEGDAFAAKEGLTAVGAKWTQALGSMYECGVDLRPQVLNADWRYGSARGGWSFYVYPVASRPSDKIRDDTLSVHYQTPFEVKDWHAVSRLPNDEGVAQVDGQIVLVDLRERTVAFLVEGHSPLVLPESVGRAVTTARAQ